MNNTQSPCVFIADDDEDDRYLLTKAFAQNSPTCCLQFAIDGIDLLDELIQCKTTPGLILLDLNMPRMGGLEALSLLRKHPIYKEVPIVILTTSSAETDRQRAIELGANEFISKPISNSQLGEVISRLRAEWLEGVCC